MSNQGWIKLHRKILSWEWYQDENTLRLFIHCLLKANHDDRKWKGIEIRRGSFITSYENLGTELKLSVQQIRTSIKKLSKITNELTYKSTRQYSLITINNYDLYQEINTQTNSKITINQQSNNNQITTNKNDKKEKETYFTQEFFEKFHSKEQMAEIVLRSSLWKSKITWNDYGKLLEDMRDWSLSKTKNKKLDWIATARSWLRKNKYPEMDEEMALIHYLETYNMDIEAVKEYRK